MTDWEHVQDWWPRHGSAHLRAVAHMLELVKAHKNGTLPDWAGTQMEGWPRHWRARLND